MKTRGWFLVLLVVALLTTSALPALAADEARPPERPKPFLLYGIIRELPGTNVDGALHAILVHVLRGNAIVKPYIGQKILILTNADTKFFRQTDDGLVEIKYEDLVVGDEVMINGHVQGNMWWAHRVVVKKPQPIPFTAQGTIQELYPTELAFDMSVERGTGAARLTDRLVIKIYTDDKTDFYCADPSGLIPIGFEDLQKGDRVQVNGWFLEGKFTAKKVVVLPPRPQLFWLMGPITEKSPDTSAERWFKVQVKHGRGAAAGLVGKEVQVFVTNTTGFWDQTSSPPGPITFDDLAVGNWVQAAGVARGSTFTAHFVVRVALPATTP
ncbi:MAG: DUF5666 domain-containing protein [Anaerolineae bacterium]